MHGIICLVSFFIRCVVLHARFTFGMLATSGADIVSCSCPYNCLASPANFIYGRYRAKFNDQLNLMTPIWPRGGGRQEVYWACVGAMTTPGGVIRGSVLCLSLYESLPMFFKYGYLQMIIV